MISDVYDIYPHSNHFDFKLDIFKSDNIEEKVINFFIEIQDKIDNNSTRINNPYAFNAMLDRINKTRHGLNILEMRYITALSFRLYCYDEKIDDYYEPKWCLITVWRATDFF